MGKVFSLIAKQGFMKRNRTLAVIGSVFRLVQLLQKLTGGGQKTLYKHKLQGDEVLVITEKTVKK